MTMDRHITAHRLRQVVAIVAALNLAYFGVEFSVATAIKSVSLFADSIDFLEDAAAVALTGARAEARRMGRDLMRRDPNLTVSEARQAWPFTPAFISRLGDGLEIAGLPGA